MEGREIQKKIDEENCRTGKQRKKVVDINRLALDKKIWKNCVEKEGQISNS